MKNMKKTALAAAVLMSVMAGSAWAETVNVGTDSAMTLSQLSTALSDAMKNAKCDVINLLDTKPKYDNKEYNLSLQMTDESFTVECGKQINLNGLALYDRDHHKNTAFIGAEDKQIVFNNGMMNVIQTYAGKSAAINFQYVTFQNSVIDGTKEFRLFNGKSYSAYDESTSGKDDFLPGALRIGAFTTATGEHIKFLGNSRTYSSNGGGAALWVQGNSANVTFGDVLFENNHSTARAGAVEVEKAGKLYLTDVQFTNNSSDGNGGAIVVGNDTSGSGFTNLDKSDDPVTRVKIEGKSIFYGNVSTGGNGGAIWNRGELIIDGASFGGDKEGQGNKAKKGGAIYSTAKSTSHTYEKGSVHPGIVNIKNTAFVDNVATEAGGAIYVEKNSAVTLENVTFSGNTAAGKPNDIYNAGTITFKGTNTLNGGIVSVSGSSLLFDTEKSSTTTIKGVSTIDSLAVTDKATVNLYDAVVTKGATVASGGVLNLAGKLGVATVTGAGNVGLADDLAVSSNANLMNLNGNGKTIDMQQTGDETVVYNTLTVGSLTGNANLKIDAKLTGNTTDDGRNDKLDINAVTNSAKITLTSVNITEDTDSAIANLAVITGNGAGALQVKDGSLQTLTGDYIYTFTLGGTVGQIAVSKNVNVQSFRDYLQQDADAIFSFTKDYVYSDSALEVTTSGTDKVKDVYLNGHLLTGKGMGADGGITVADGYTLNMDGAPQSGSNSVISGFTTAFSVVSGGVLNLKNVTLSGNTMDISNAGTVNLSGTVTANSISGAGTLSNAGTLNIGASGLQNSVTNTGTVNLGAGTLGAAVTGGTLNVNDDVTANAGYIAGTTNNVADGKTLTLNGGAVANAITNNGTVKLTGVTGMSAAVNGGTLSIEQDLTADASYIAGNDNIVAAGKTLDLNGNAAMAKVITNKGTLNANVELQGMVSNSGIINLNAGKYSDIGTSDYVPLTNFTGSGKLNLDKVAFYNTDSANVFTTKIQGVDVYGASGKTNDDAKTFVNANKDLTIAVSDGIKLTLVGGFVEISDAYYTADYAKSAKNALETYKYDGTNLSKTGLAFTGKIVSAILDDPQKESHVLIQEIEEENVQPGPEPSQPTEYDKAVAETLNGSLFVGEDILKKGGAAEKIAEETKKGEGDKGIDVKDTSKSSISVGALDLAGGATGLVIANDKGVTVGGSDGKKTEVILVKVNGDHTKPVNVVVGLTEDTAQILGVAKEGTFNIGNSQADKDAKYKLNGSLTANVDSKVNIKGQTTITESVTLNGAKLTVEEGSKVTTPKVEVKGKAEVNGKGVVKTDLFALDDSEANVSQVTKVEADNITVDSTDENENSKKSSVMTGIVEAKKLIMNQALAKGNGIKTVVLHVGTNDKPAIAYVGDTKLGGNMMLIDPAWKDGVGLEGASHYATETTVLDGAYVVGQNSILTFGATNADADALFGSTGLNWGEHNVSAAAYAAKSIDVTNGSLTVDGLTTDVPAMPDNGSVKFADKSLFMVNGNICQNNAAVTGVKSVDIASGAKLYIDGAEVGTYKVLDIVDSVDDASVVINGWLTGNDVLANSFVTFDSVENRMSGDKGFYVTFKYADVDLSETVMSNVGEEMAKDIVGSPAREVMKKMLSDLYTKVQKAANVNTYANLGENLGVTRGAYDVISMTGEAINQHWANKEDGESVWAVYNHSKDKVNGLKLGGMDAQYDAQYNGVTVGYDINKDFGIALNHVDGNVTNGFGGHNDAKYYGVSVYGRKNFGKVSLLGDVTYSHGKNELAQNGIEADAKTNTFSMGVTAKYATNIVKVGNVTPFAGVRYVRIDGKDYTDSLGVNREADKVNSLIVPMGVEYSAEFNVSGSDWNCKPVLALGYLFNFGDKDNTMTLGYNGAKDNFGYDFVDNGAFFTKAALNFTKNNLTLGVGYDYMKSSNSNNNRWNVNLNYAF